MLRLSARRFCVSPMPKFSEEIAVSERSNGVFDVQLSRPASQNSFTMPLWRSFIELFGFLSEHSKCRAIVLHGGAQSKSFCSGIDLKTGITELFQAIQDEKLDAARKARFIRNFVLTAQQGFTAIEKCQKPVIAAIHGHCLGAGISLAGCCDIRYSTSTANFSIKEVDVGIAADVGILQRIQGITGNDSWARELAFTAREFNGYEALKFGFVSRVFDTREQCLEASYELAERIASKSPIAVQGSKLAMNYARNHGVDAALEWQATWNQSQLQTNDIFESATAKMKKQKPEFKDV